MRSEEATLLFCLPSQSGSTLKEKNLLLLEQILFIKSRPHVKELHHPMDGWMNGWMDDLRFYVLFNSTSVISGQCSDDNERLCGQWNSVVG